MSKPNYEQLGEKALAAQNPPAYSEKEAYAEPDPLKQPPGPAPQAGYGAVPAPQAGYGAMPYYGPPGAGSNLGPVLQPPQAVYVTPVQPTNEPDYLIYSIFTMLCCCLPLGIAALVYSIQTREANFAGNAASAKRNSRMARLFGHIALGIGLGCLVIYIIIVVVVSTTAAYLPPQKP
ncbi:proline-rich transmembrane protein 1-like [Podarcis muralis]|uniref:transmembrane protein 91-like isoform X1 n=1 Tax=Podarcis muralis TaxID=64176 RepID=UPI00109FEF51|nr:transmembrane protein 91-like isoform X1 [Podarcis muralis]